MARRPGHRRLLAGSNDLGGNSIDSGHVSGHFWDRFLDHFWPYVLNKERIYSSKNTRLTVVKTAQKGV